MMKYILSSSNKFLKFIMIFIFRHFNELNEDVYEEFNLKRTCKESVEFFNDIFVTKI